MEDASPLVLFGQKAWRTYVRLLGRAARKPAFTRMYALTSLLILIATTVLWAVLGARLQAHNADQLSDPYMFSSLHTFHGAVFPSAHTFLIKWPLFWLVAAFGVSSTSLIATTVAVALVPVLVLIVIIYKIDRRPLVFGTMCLALSLALLLIPAQAYPGGLLPVNMAMLTTRNLEYAVYLLVLLCFAKARRVRSWGVIVGTILLTLLIASDKLFAGLSIGGALLAVSTFAIKRKRAQVMRASNWLIGSIAAVAAATALLWIITKTGVTHFSGGNASPYGVSHSGKNIALGVAYALLGLLTNVGANPVYDNKVLGDLPGSLVHRLWSLTSFVYVIAVGAFAYALWSVWKTAYRSGTKTEEPDTGTAATFARQLVYSTVVALAIFVATNHYYAVDARYLTIALFALAVSTSVWLRNKQWRWPEDLLLIGSTFIVAIVIAIGVAARISDQQTQALSVLDQRNSLVAQTLERHKVDVLVGDYWRVLPIKFAAHGTVNSLPLANCTQPTAALTSSNWRPDLKTHSFAYLVTLDDTMLTNFPKCSLPQVTATYGQPNAVQIIAGTPSKPAEALLFYDQGMHPTSASNSEPTPILPIGLDQLENTQCTGDTVMNVVAHQDDDLLFLSPDLLHDVQSGKCVRTVYLTAGDSGFGKLYWLSRQLGAEAAYDNMLGRAGSWQQHTVAIAPREYITIASPRSNPRISLVFFNLPDGGLQGDGFARSDHQSLQMLHAGTLQKIKSVDGSSSYTSDQLVAALRALMNAYGPSVVHTQAQVGDDVYPDHSDHLAAGLYASVAAEQYSGQQFGDSQHVSVIRYIGYPVHSYQDNISEDDRAQKEAAFLAYAAHDGGVCHTVDQCAETPTYSAYIARQYIEDPSQP